MISHIHVILYSIIELSGVVFSMSGGYEWRNTPLYRRCHPTNILFTIMWRFSLRIIRGLFARSHPLIPFQREWTITHLVFGTQVWQFSFLWGRDGWVWGRYAFLLLSFPLGNKSDLRTWINISFQLNWVVTLLSVGGGIILLLGLSGAPPVIYGGVPGLKPSGKRGRKGKRAYRYTWPWIEAILSWIGKEYFGVVLRSGKDARVLTPLLDRVRKVVRASGVNNSLKFIKNERQKFLYCLSLLGTSREKDALNRIRWRWGIPMMVVVQKSQSGNPWALNCVRMALTVLTSLRFVRGSGPPDLSSVTSESTALGWDSHEVIQAGVRFWTSLRVPVAARNLKKVEWRHYHSTTRAGPSGHALWTAFGDLVSLQGEAPGILDCLIRMGGSRFKRNLDLVTRERVVERVKTIFPSEPGILRRIAALPDLEGKVRPIALGDYWSQSVLRPLHLWTFSVLKTIPQDVTFHQDAFVEKVSSWGRVVSYHSVDMTSATDRFPIDFIGQLLQSALSTDYVTDWKRVLTELPFFLKEGGRVLPEAYHFKCGTPLGFYGSWGPFALAHHFVMFLCGEEVGCKTPLKYVILGDDILIGDPDLAQAYHRWLLRLGVSYSEMKTYVSPNMCEFAKRYLFRQSLIPGAPVVEITPFPLALVWAAESSVPLLVSAMWGEAKKGLAPASGVPGAVRELDKTLYPLRGVCSGTSSKRAFKRARLAYHCDAVLRLVQGKMSVEDAVRIILNGHPMEQAFNAESAMILVKRACAALYHSSLLSGKDTLNTSFLGNTFRALLRSRNPATRVAATPNRPRTAQVIMADYLAVLALVPAAGSYRNLERSMLSSLDKIGVDGVPLESWPDFVRSVNLGVSGLDPRVPDKGRQVIAASSLARAIEKEATQLKRGPKELRKDFYTDALGFLKDRIPMPFSLNVSPYGKVPWGGGWDSSENFTPDSFSGWKPLGLLSLVIIFPIADLDRRGDVGGW